MTRRIIYANQLANSLFALEDQKEAMLAMGFLAQAILGTTTEIDGLNCTPNSPADMTVLLSQGTIFKYVDVDATAYGELPSQLPADTTNSVLKYAYNIGSFQTPVFEAPTTVGFSRNDLIQINFQEVDGDSENIPFWGGVTNQTINGVSVPIPNPVVSQTKNVRRLCNVVIEVKQGTAAATGTQTTPAPDAGFVGAWVVTTTNGSSTITSSNIARYTNAPFITEKLKDKISQATADARYALKSEITGQFSSYNVFTSSGTWTKPAGVTKVLVYVTGSGGGGGAGDATNAGSGAGAGATAIKLITSGLNETETVTVGAPGTPGSGGGNGGTGGTSSFGAHCSATGGQGGAPNGPGGQGGIAIGGDININGGGGEAQDSNEQGGMGGASKWGGGGNGTVQGTAGQKGAAFGSGGSGGGGQGGSVNGGEGGDAIVIVYNFN